MVYRHVFACCAVALLLAGCTPSLTVNVAVNHPAQINTSQFKRVYVGDFRNLTNVPNLQDRIAYALVNQLSAQARYAVVEKSVYDRFGSNSGENLADMFVITGAVTTYHVDDDVKEGKPYHDDNDKEKDRMHIDKTRTTKLNYAVEFRVSRAVDATVIATRSMPREQFASVTERDREPRRADVQELARVAESEIVTAFMETLLPHREVLHVDFLTEETIPELEKGIGSCSKGDWEVAMGVFNGAISKYIGAKSVQRALIYYDLGLAQQYTNHYDDAMVSFKQAAQLDPDSDRYTKAQSSCRAQQAEYRVWLEQKWE